MRAMAEEMESAGFRSTADTNIPLARSLRGKFIFLLAVLVALTATVLTIVDYVYVRQLLSSSVQEQLTLRAEGIREVLLTHVRQRGDGIRLVASRTRLRELLEARLEGQVDLETFREATSRILLDAQQSIDGFLNTRITDPDGLVVTATDITHLGANLAASRAFIDGRTEPTLGLPVPAAGNYRAMLSAPVTSHTGKFLGVVVVEVDAQPELDILTAVPSGFDSAEVRLGAWKTPAGARDRIRYLFPLGAAHTLSIQASEDAAMRAALNGATGFAETTDYLGREVLSVHIPVGYGGWAMVAQVAADEAYAPIGQVGLVALVVAIVFFLLAALVGARIAAVFTRPVLRLARVARAVEGGDMSVQARISTQDELGLLGNAFNTMMSSVSLHQNNLETLVRERTVQLEESRDQLADLCRVLENHAETMERDLKRAEVIQRSLLPGAPPEIAGFCVHTLYRPGHNVGGDLFDIVKIDDRRLVLVIADASGHGVSAAMLSVLFKHRLAFADSSGRPLRPSEALQRVNRSLLSGPTTPGMFVTCIYCLLDIEKRVAVIASAGHSPAILVGRYGKTDQVEHTGPALGLYRDAVFAECEIPLGEQDQLLFYTDGIFDIGGDEKPNIGSIGSTLVKHGEGQHVLDELFIELSRGHEREDRDDVTMLLLEGRSGESYFGSDDDVPELEVDPPADAPMLTWGETDAGRFLCLQGRVTWIYAEPLLESARGAIGSGRPLIVDLGECDYLDSALLGTLHELVQEAEEGTGGVTVQGANASLLEAFRELSMDVVLNHVSERALAIPDNRESLELPDADPKGQKMRLLKAHEVLAALSRDNEAEFGGVVAAMRQDMGVG